ncbi:MAG: glycosyltransferase [Flavobacteriales bacterium]
MKVVILSNTDSGGGAAIAARRLNDALNNNSVKSHMLVLEKKSANEKVVSLSLSPLRKKILKGFTYFEYLFQRKILLKDKTVAMFSTNEVGVDVSKHPLIQNADVINIHWINFGFLSLRDIESLYALNKPIVWTLHDMWLFTGGCHYSGECTQFEHNCSACPIVYLKKTPSLLWKKKELIFKNRKINIVAPSQWLVDESKRASLTKNAHSICVPNTLNSSLFTNLNKEEACKKLGLDTSKKYILFSAANPNDVRKGFSYFVDAVERLKNEYANHTQLELLVMGKEQKAFSSLALKVNNLGFITSEDKAALIYSAASVFVIPSLEDNLPNTIMEALSCGTPCVGFAIGGIQEMIRTGVNGYLAKPRDAKDLTEGIVEVLNSSSALEAGARTWMLEKYSNEVIAKQYLKVFDEA